MRSSIALLIACGLGGCDDTTTERPPPNTCPLPSTSPRVVELHGAGEATMALMSDGSVWCWGEDSRNICGGWSFYARPLALSCVESLNVRGFAVARHTDGSATLWGASAPVLPDDAGVEDFQEIGDVSDVVSGGSHVTARTPSGELFMLGSLWFSDPPRDTLYMEREFGRLPFDPGVVRAAGAAAICAVYGDGHVECLGSNKEGQLGFVEPESALQPTRLTFVGKATDVAMDWGITCLLMDDGAVQCAGRNTYGQLGTPWSYERRPWFQKVPDLPPVDRIEIGSGGNVVCGLTGGELWCWGSNTFTAFAPEDGRLGATKVEPYDDIVDFSVGSGFLCILRETGDVLCRGWVGSNGRCEPGDDFEWGPVSFEYCDGFAYE